jgi:expansin (peptidoglycan-binding protein)
VQCPVGSSTFRYGYQGGNPWYRKMMVANARVPVRNVQMWRDGKWNQLTRTIDNYWCALLACWGARRSARIALPGTAHKPTQHGSCCVQQLQA